MWTFVSGQARLGMDDVQVDSPQWDASLTHNESRYRESSFGVTLQVQETYSTEACAGGQRSRAPASPEN